MRKVSKRTSKRRFIKNSLLGMTGICFGLESNVFSEDFKKWIIPDNQKKNLWKWSKEGMFYEQTPRGVTCLICPNECTIKEGDLGDCRSRTNHEGKLYSIAYGNPCAVHMDPIEKKPLYHFYPSSMAYSVATAGCNLACLNCQNWTISQKSPRDTRNYDLMPEKLIQETLNSRCKSIAYTYSEPVTFFEYTYDSSKLARTKGIRNVIVSAGYINEKPLRELAKYIDAANIDLKSFKDSIYLRLNGGKLQPILNTLKILKEEGVWVEITNLVVPSWTDDLVMIKEMCKWLKDNGFEDNPLHFSRFHPQYKLTQLPATPVGTLQEARNIATREGLKYVYVGNVPGSGAENTYCPDCKKMIIERRGYKILSNNIVKNRCRYCNAHIAGVWD